MINFLLLNNVGLQITFISIFFVEDIMGGKAEQIDLSPFVKD